MQKKGDWFVGDYIIQTTGLELDVLGQKEGYGGGYRDGMIAVLCSLKGKAPKHILNMAFEKAVANYSDRQILAHQTPTMLHASTMETEQLSPTDFRGATTISHQEKKE